MFAQERFQKISELLSRKQRLSVQELQRSLHVSPATLRRDLAELEHAGKLIRIHGGVMHPSYYNGEPSYDQKVRENAEAKSAMARRACNLVGPNSIVFVDSGSTCMEIGRRLIERKDLTVITNSIPLLAAAHNAQAQIICIGGQLRVVNKALVGPLSLQWLENISLDCLIMGASGITLERGATTTELTEAHLKMFLLKRAAQRILVADATKWNTNRAVTFAKLSDFDCWITSADLSESVARIVRRQGVQVILADDSPTESVRPEKHAL
ncbi:MAG: DeoR/GlpR family DNA-binding transcription regulator [Verrucomicrobiae bacterium]|nr:DeoR/GlpR family DNA-binding transcription regulator [Verrucomicrobiae bacterium]